MPEEGNQGGLASVNLVCFGEAGGSSIFGGCRRREGIFAFYIPIMANFLSIAYRRWLLSLSIRLVTLVQKV